MRRRRPCLIGRRSAVRRDSPGNIGRRACRGWRPRSLRRRSTAVRIVCGWCCRTCIVDARSNGKPAIVANADGVAFAFCGDEDDVWSARRSRHDWSIVCRHRRDVARCQERRKLVQEGHVLLALRRSGQAISSAVDVDLRRAGLWSVGAIVHGDRAIRSVTCPDR